MKRILCLVLVLTLISGMLIGCGSNENDDTDKDVSNENVEVKDEGEGSIEVDKKLISVEVTFPESLLAMDDEEIDYDEIINEAEKEEGMLDAVKNDDGSITYKMTKARHTEMMSQLSEDILEAFDDLINDDDFASIKDITSDKKFSKIEVIVDKLEFENSFDGFGIFGIAMQSMFYQVYDGVAPDKYEVEVSLSDVDTNEVFDTIVYPDAFDAFNE